MRKKYPAKPVIVQHHGQIINSNVPVDELAVIEHSELGYKVLALIVGRVYVGNKSVENCWRVRVALEDGNFAKTERYKRLPIYHHEGAEHLVQVWRLHK